MVIDANTVNECGEICIDCAKKSLITDNVVIYGDDKPKGVAISVRCEHADMCQFLIERIAAYKLKEKNKNEEQSCMKCTYTYTPANKEPCRSCGLIRKNFERSKS